MKIRSDIFAAPLAALLCIGAAAPSYAQTKVETGQKSTALSDLKADDIKGKDVLSTENNQKIGDIAAVIINRGGQVEAVVIGVGGFLGMGERDVAVAWDRLGRTADKNFTLKMTKDEVRALPAYVYPKDRGNRVAFEDESYAARVSKAPSVADSRATTATRQETMERNVAASTQDEKGWNDSLTQDGRIKASSFVGAEVMNGQEDSIGEIEEFLIGKTGEAKALISVGGFLGVGDRHVLVDWKDLKIEHKDHSVRVSVDMTKDHLMKLPAYKD